MEIEVDPAIPGLWDYRLDLPDWDTTIRLDYT